MKTGIYKTMDIELSRSYQFILGKNLVDELADHIMLEKNQKLMLVSDSRVWGLYGMRIDAAFTSVKNPVYHYIIDEGESSKNLKNLCDLLESLAENNFTKADKILAIGGGVVGDLAGLAASIYLRGIDHIFVATTTLAAFDSSVGGKTAVNLKNGKNLVGSFKQPQRVLCDLSMFESLSDRIFYEGMAEAVKYAFICDINMLCLFERDLRSKEDLLCQIIERSILNKSKLVAKDEFDRGKRMLLNFGHTIGHAIEKKSDYNLRHGEAVAIGMVWMLKLSIAKGILSKENTNANARVKEILRKKEPLSLLEDLLKQYVLPVESEFVLDDLLSLIKLDKKIRESYINIILLESIGMASVRKVKLENLDQYLRLS